MKELINSLHNATMVEIDGFFISDFIFNGISDSDTMKDDTTVLTLSTVDNGVDLEWKFTKSDIMDATRVDDSDDWIVLATRGKPVIFTCYTSI